MTISTGKPTADRYKEREWPIRTPAREQMGLSQGVPNLPLLSKPDADQYSAAAPIVQDNHKTKWSKKVPASWSKKVPARVRKSAFKDAKILRKIQGFRVPDGFDPDVSSSVVTSTPLRSPLQSLPKSPLTHSNDNLIPAWGKDIGDHVKAVAATGALLIADKPACAFTFNLTPEAIEKSKADPRGFLESLKRPFDKQLARASVSLPYYWFVIDIAKEGRLHIHGAFLRPKVSVRTDLKIKEAMRDAWGRWHDPDSDHKQICFKPLYSDGWVDYCFEDRRKVAKIIGPRTLTISQPLQRDAKSTYNEVRRIMRSAYGTT